MWMELGKNKKIKILPTLSTKISPVVLLMSNLLWSGLSVSIPCPVKKYTMFSGLSLSPSVAVTWTKYFYPRTILWIFGKVADGKMILNWWWTYFSENFFNISIKFLFSNNCKSSKCWIMFNCWKIWMKRN